MTIPCHLQMTCTKRSLKVSRSPSRLLRSMGFGSRNLKTNSRFGSLEKSSAIGGAEFGILKRCLASTIGAKKITCQSQILLYNYPLHKECEGYANDYELQIETSSSAPAEASISPRVRYRAFIN